MKVYIITEGAHEKIIRGVTLSFECAKKICAAFHHLGLEIETHEIIDEKSLRSFLDD